MITESRCLTNADGGGGDDGGDGHVGDGDDDDEGRLPAKKADMLVSKRSGQSTCDGANAVANKHEGTVISKRSGQAACAGANTLANDDTDTHSAIIYSSIEEAFVDCFQIDRADKPRYRAILGRGVRKSKGPK